MNTIVYITSGRYIIYSCFTKKKKTWKKSEIGDITLNKKDNNKLLFF